MSTANDALHWLSIEELGRLYRSKELSPVEVTRALLERIAALDPVLHAYVTVLADEALESGWRAERELGSGHDRGPLHGVPVAVKDLCDLAGTPTTAGTVILRDRLARTDSCVVERLQAAGAVILGKLAMTEGAYSAHHPSVTPPVNPWAAERWPGVSSSGSGVAVASGLAFAALGSDTGGSIRFPSAVNGVVGIKPTWGRVPRHGVFPLAASLDHVGPMARSPWDAAAVLGAIAGADPRDPTSLLASVPDYLAGSGDGIRGLRIGIDERYCREGMDEEIVSTVVVATEALVAAGATIVPITMPPWAEVVGSWPVVCAVEAAVAHEGLFPEQADAYGPELRGLLETGAKIPATLYAKAHETRLAFSGALPHLFDEIDLVACPSLGMATPRADLQLDAADAEALIPLILRFTAPFDFSGSPTISVPCGFTKDGLPISLQLVGGHLEEALLVRAATAYRERTEWAERRPPLAA